MSRALQLLWPATGCNGYHSDSRAAPPMPIIFSMSPIPPPNPPNPPSPPNPFPIDAIIPVPWEWVRHIFSGMLTLHLFHVELISSLSLHHCLHHFLHSAAGPKLTLHLLQHSGRHRTLSILTL
jgi:hypothetical protein